MNILPISVALLTVIVAGDAELEEGVGVGVDVARLVEGAAEEAVAVVANVDGVRLAGQNGALVVSGSGTATGSQYGIDGKENSASITIYKIK